MGANVANVDNVNKMAYVGNLIFWLIKLKYVFAPVSFL